MNQEIRPSAQDATLFSEELSQHSPDEYRPLLLRRDLIAMLPYLNRTEFCRRAGWDQAREVDCGFNKAADPPRLK